eukprot:m.126211 g.126211  ORF g.126211 m.126211 type:complete len:162 (+) comp17360_c0_seq1:187-672(+)
MSRSMHGLVCVVALLGAFNGQFVHGGNCVVTVPNPTTTDVLDSGWSAAGTLKNCIDQGDSSGGFVYISFNLPYVGDAHQVVLPTIRMQTISQAESTAIIINGSTQPLSAAALATRNPLLPRIKLQVIAKDFNPSASVDSLVASTCSMNAVHAHSARIREIT